MSTLGDLCGLEETSHGVQWGTPIMPVMLVGAWYDLPLQASTV